MPTIVANHHSLFYAQVGQPTAGRPSLVLLHGAGGNHLVWPGEVLRLPHTAVCALDLPGHGRSAGPGCDTITAYANIVTDFLAAIGWDDVVLAGHSMGGAIAQTLAIRQHPAVRGVVLIGTGARLRVADAILSQILPNFETAVDIINRFAWATATPLPVVQHGRTFLAHTDPQVMYGDFVACNNFDVTQHLAQLDQPALVIAAEEDRLTPAKYGRFLAEHLPHSRLIVLPQAGHMMMVEQPTAVAEAIRQFLHDEFAWLRQIG